jgi:glucose-1-phosphate thymidylyltransferase
MQARFVEQKEAKGQSQAIQLARDYITEPTLVIFGDTIWEADLSRLARVKGDGLIFVKEVADPRRFGIAFLKDGFAVKLVEKPQTAESKLAIVGVYYFREFKRLLLAIDEQIAKNVQTKNEYFLADGAIDVNAAKMEVETIPLWEDLGCRSANQSVSLNKNGTMPRNILAL